ncbi:hypothetical protein EYF88_14015 [Paracoccus sediminis]|uniref:Antifreeze glycopeptide polyprotein n=2 Tax=Paracoccus sediminis TaxID=1214787 RepID=A0A238XMQ5_9RHOB|nr:hypothetical protein EYF88_14015 [Paracoccus sediminis]SNR60296.1 hypothetical protein SAMN06265378_11139 [Paracoccus sediminis]
MTVILALAGAAQAQQPLSASDWLSGSVRGPDRESSAWRPGDAPPPGVPGAPGPRPVARTGAVGSIQVTRLGNGNPDAAGLVTPRKAGLPPRLWEGSDTATLSALVLRTPARLPAMNALLDRILATQFVPPPAGPGAAQGALFLARADRLLDMGALDRAQALLIAAGPSNPEIFRRLFDIALLKGDESRACGIMNTTPGIAPSFAARIFCLAQTGDWAAAAISLNGAETLGLLDARQAELLTHFLDDAYVDSAEALPMPDRVTPLDFRIHEAIGQPLPTTSLPLAFAHSDLRPNNGWKARLESAERLARAGAMPPGALRALYSEQKPAASGGVWERAGAMRTLEAALATGDPSPALPQAFDQFRAADMADVLAAMIAADLPQGGGGRSAEIATWLRQWQGLPTPVPLILDPALKADPVVAPETRQGESLLNAMADIDAGLDGDLPRAGRGLAMLRALGLTAEADLAAAQLSLLPVMRQTGQ